MRPGDRSLRTHAMAARAWPDAADVRWRRYLAVRSRRQRAVAAGARQRRSAADGAGIIFRFHLPVDIQSAIRSDTGVAVSHARKNALLAPGSPAMLGGRPRTSGPQVSASGLRILPGA